MQPGPEAGLAGLVSRLPPLWPPLLALLAGCGTLFAFSPYGLYPLAIVGPALLLLLWSVATPRLALLEGWLFGLGLLGTGVFWLHISIDQFGNVGTSLAVLITVIFVALLALFYGLAGWLGRRLVHESGAGARGLMMFALLWLLSEWLRGWLFGGFPWLSLGYSQIDSVLAGWAPIVGVYGVSLAVVLSAACLLLFFQPGWRLIAALGLLALWGGGALLTAVEWGRPIGAPLRVSIVQGNIPQSEKWKRENLQPTLDLYQRLTRSHWDRDLIIWPETAVPAFARQVERRFLAPLSKESERHHSTLLLGIADWDPQQRRYYNAMLSLGEERGAYYKRHLVPFGEFMPMQWLLQPLIDWLRIPMSNFAPGMAQKPLLNLSGYPAGISICYEDAFGNEVIQALPEAAFLVNASNDAWFGDSLALPQHLEIARMRALESGRYLLRATNTGISAIIAPDGSLQEVSPAFQRHVLSGSLVPMGGSTPYVRFGNGLVIGLAGLLLALLWWRGRRT